MTREQKKAWSLEFLRAAKAGGEQAARALGQLVKGANADTSHLT
jgi:hypothetical protein